jgi:hypothetical protein
MIVNPVGGAAVTSIEQIAPSLLKAFGCAVAKAARLPIAAGKALPDSSIQLSVSIGCFSLPAVRNRCAGRLLSFLDPGV